MTAAFAVVFWAMMLIYAVAVAAQLASQAFLRPRLGKTAYVALGCAIVLHTSLVAWRWIETGHIPTIGNFENALFGGWFIAVMAAWAAWRERYPIVAAAALPFALLVLGGGALSDTSPSPFVASLNSFWLYIHIFFAWLAYGAYTVACGTGIVYLVKTRAGGPPAPRDELARLEELMFRSTVFGFVTDGVMIAAGAIWAKDLWGSYWSWDPVETWSLLSWLIYGLALHLQRTLGWRGRPIAWILVFAVVTVIVTFWGVNLVMSGSSHIFNVG
ncbi:MAG: cytochrome c biogenesis protein CcsA [Anaeromyxobacteraceae bacterium]